MRDLPRQQLNAVWLRILLGFSFGEVASAMGCSLSTAKTHHWRGIAVLRRRRGERTSAELDEL
jgi:DNA-directed RNA polymerase specialized sigma24 family protein